MARWAVFAAVASMLASCDSGDFSGTAEVTRPAGLDDITVNALGVRSPQVPTGADLTDGWVSVRDGVLRVQFAASSGIEGAPTDPTPGGRPSFGMLFWQAGDDVPSGGLVAVRSDNDDRSFTVLGCSDFALSPGLLPDNLSPGGFGGCDVPAGAASSLVGGTLEISAPLSALEPCCFTLPRHFRWAVYSRWGGDHPADAWVAVLPPQPQSWVRYLTEHLGPILRNGEPRAATGTMVFRGPGKRHWQPARRGPGVPKVWPPIRAAFP